MENYKINDIYELIKDNPYVGRGIIIGKSKDSLVFGYFIMGRSENSRNRIFVEDGDTLYTKAYDESKVTDPKLIIYNAIRQYKNKIIVTNGDQTDDIYNGLVQNKSIYEILKNRKFEPDKPVYTPRISGLIEINNNDFNYVLSILKSMDENAIKCSRYYYEYESIKNLGHLIHTYKTDGNPVPSFVGEPKRIIIEDDIDEFTNKVWNSLNKDNKISLYVKYVNLENNKVNKRLVNKNEG